MCIKVDRAPPEKMDLRKNFTIEAPLPFGRYSMIFEKSHNRGP
jgi:hypothetical protein